MRIIVKMYVEEVLPMNGFTPKWQLILNMIEEIKAHRHVPPIRVDRVGRVMDAESQTVLEALKQMAHLQCEVIMHNPLGLD